MATPNYTVTTANENEKYLDKFLLFFMWRSEAISAFVILDVRHFL